MTTGTGQHAAPVTAPPQTWLARSLTQLTRIELNPADLSTTAGADESWLGTWLDQPTSVVVEPTTRHIDIVEKLLSDLGTAGNLVNDAHLAALALEHGADIVSFDADFSRFEGVRWLTPDG